MGKVSFAYSDFSKGGGFGLQAGRYEVTDCRSKVHGPQASKDGHQANPFTCIEFDVVKLDDKWNRVSDEVIQHQFPVAFSQDENGTIVLKARPGKASSATDDNPKDLCKDKDTVQEMVDIEGNTIVVDDDAASPYKPWNQSPWALFIESIEAKGFKPEINRQGFTENYVGMKFACENKELPKPKNWKKEQPPTALVCTAINVFPYEGKKKGQTAASASTAASTAASTSALAKTNGAAAGNVESLFHAAVKKFVEANKGAKMSRADFRTKLGQPLMAIKEISIKGTPPLIKAHVSSDEGLVALSMEHGFEVDTETWEISL